MSSPADDVRRESGQILFEQLRLQQMELQIRDEELRHTKCVLEALRGQYFDLYHLAPVGYLTLGGSDEIIESNLRAASLLGTTHSTLKGRRFGDWLSGHGSDVYYLTRRQLLKTGAPQSCEVNLRRGQDPSFWARLEMSVSFVDSEDHSPANVFHLVIVDISERKSVERRFEVFMEYSPVGAAVIDEDGRYVDVNPAMQAHTGRSKEAWIGKGFSQVWPAGIWERFYWRHAEVLKTNQAVTGKEILQLPNKESVQQITFFPFGVNNGKKLVGCVSVDITELHCVQTDLRATNALLISEKCRAEENTLAKTHFLSTMSHEIRTPLSGVIGMAGLLLNTSLTLEQSDYTRGVVDSAEGLLGLVNEILDLSKIEAGKVELESTSLDLESLIEDVMASMSFEANAKSLELACRYPADTPRHFVGDAVRLRQVMTNLLSNAIKFTSSGYVLVEVEVANAVNNISDVQLSVHDTGIGISIAKQSNLFTSYEQADSSIAKRFGGTGLGLSIVKEIIKLMSGEVSVTSTEGQGATFRFQVPLALGSGKGAPADYLNVGQLRGKSICLASAQRMTPFLTAEWCRWWGMDVTQCEVDSLSQALHKSRPQLVIAEGDRASLVRAMAAIQSLPADRPKLILIPTTSSEGTSGLLADAVLFSPVRTRKLWQTVLDVMLAPQEKRPMILPARQVITPLLASTGRSCRVLVADDNVINRKIAVSFLSRMGCDVDVAGDGSVAVEKVAKNDYHIVFMDCVMPEMNGLTATQEIRNLSGKPRLVPIIALTASATTDDREQCFAVGMNDFLTKPIRSDQLAECLSKWLVKSELDQAT